MATLEMNLKAICIDTYQDMYNFVLLLANGCLVEVIVPCIVQIIMFTVCALLFSAVVR